MEDLKDVQIKVLTEADIYRESGGETEEDVTSNTGPGGPTKGEALARAKAGHGSPSMPNI